MTEVTDPHDANTVFCALLAHSREWQNRDTYPRTALSMSADAARVAAQFACDEQAFGMLQSRLVSLQAFAEDNGLLYMFERDLSGTVDLVSEKLGD